MTQAIGIWDTKESAELHLDADGWPISLPAYDDWSVSYRWVTTLMFNGISGRYPSGKYIVLYDGKGTLEYGLDASKNYAESTPGRDVLDVTAGRTAAGISLSIKATDPFGEGDYIRNVRVLMPGFDETNYEAHTFHPTFLQNISQYKVLRFMDWMRTNWHWNESGPKRDNNDPELSWSHPLHDAEFNPYLRYETAETTRSGAMLTWNQRPKPTDSTYASVEGVPVEMMVALANTTGADPWFNMPHLASDDYIEGFATAVFAGLNPSQRVYVEFSNEVWNNGFGQSHWVERQGIAQWPLSTVSPLEKRLSWYGERSAEMCNIWKTVYGGAADRVICIIATQASNTWIGEKMLDCPLSDMAPCYANVNAVAIAPYFGQHIGSEDNRLAVTEWIGRWDGGLTKLFNELEYGSQLVGGTISKTSLHEAKQNMTNYAGVAAARNLSLVAYEGGQHLAAIGTVASDTAITGLFSTANRDSRMMGLYADYLEHWDSTGGEMFVIFSSSGVYSQWGNWGAHEYADEVNTPKQTSISTFIAENSCDWADCQPAAGSVPTAVALSHAQTTAPTATLAVLTMMLLALTQVAVQRRSSWCLATVVKRVE